VLLQLFRTMLQCQIVNQDEGTFPRAASALLQDSHHFLLVDTYDFFSLAPAGAQGDAETSHGGSAIQHCRVSLEWPGQNLLWI
jgi:hypothetical protein